MEQQVIFAPSNFFNCKELLCNEYFQNERTFANQNGNPMFKNGLILLAQSESAQQFTA